MLVKVIKSCGWIRKFIAFLSETVTELTPTIFRKLYKYLLAFQKHGSYGLAFSKGREIF